MQPRRSSEEFVRLFREVKRQVGDTFDRARVLQCLDSNEKFAALADRLSDLDWEFKRAFVEGPRKIHGGFHPDFRGEYMHFCKGWSQFSDCYSGWKLRDWHVELPSAEQLLKELDAFLEKPNAVGSVSRDDEETLEFDSERDSAARLVEQLVEVARDDDGFGDVTLGMAEAFDWFVRRGLDLERFERRWKMIPWVAVPGHVASEPIGVAIPRGLQWLLEEVVRTFCLGNDAAAIALCRAITEELVEEVYLEFKRDRMLGQNISDAEHKYPQLKRHNLSDRVRIANEVLHDAKLEVSQFKPWNNAENFIREWILSLKALIETAPQRKR